MTATAASSAAPSTTNTFSPPGHASAASAPSSPVGRSHAPSPTPPEPEPSEYTLRPAERLVSALAGSLLTSLLVTPLDVVKTRMQAATQASPGSATVMGPRIAHHPPMALRRIWLAAVARMRPPQPQPGPSHLAITACCREVFFSGSVRAHPCAAGPCHSRVHPRGLHAPAVSAAAATVEAAGPAHRGTLDAMVHIARAEGASALWRGLAPTLIMSLPANVIYFMGYDWLRAVVADNQLASEGSAALFAGGFARTVAVAVISPLELVRTRMQGNHAAQASIQRILHQIRGQTRQYGARYLWRGLSATLWRDVPFSALYWYNYESFKARYTALLPASDSPLVPSFFAGATSGMIAAIVTTPFDVAKTRRQLAHAPHTHRQHHPARPSVWWQLREIAKVEGPRALFAGIVPRVAKVAPACAIMISTYEYGKYFFGTVRHSTAGAAEEV
ncbi:hypothetical protein GGF31_003616 [Allomyces arbusculus]|nr:hypothetical protein GGF31_003616 [Allomyces arbusculus]